MANQPLEVLQVVIELQLNPSAPLGWLPTVWSVKNKDLVLSHRKTGDGLKEHSPRRQRMEFRSLLHSHQLGVLGVT